MSLVDPDKIQLEHIYEAEDVVFTQTYDTRPIQAKKIPVIFAYDGKKLVLTVVIIQVQPEGRTSVYCVGGGASQSYSVQNVQAFVRLCAARGDVDKAVLFESYPGCPREFDTDTGPLFAKILISGMCNAILPADRLLAIGDSFGCVSIVSFLQALQEAKYGHPMHMLLFEPVGFVKNPLLPLFFMLNFPEVLREGDKGRALQDFFLSWALPADTKMGVKAFLLDSIYKRRQYMKHLASFYGLHRCKSSNLPVLAMGKGIYAESGKMLQDMGASLVFASKSLDPLVKRNNGNIAAIREYYASTVFPQVSKEHLQVCVINGAHSLLYAPASPAELIEHMHFVA